MTANASHPEAGFASSIWRDTAGWMRAADISAMLLAASVPWSTTFVAIFAVAWLITLVPTIDLRALRDTVSRPVAALPIALVALAVIGTLWAAGTPWDARFYGINPPAKLLAIPLLLYHFHRSDRGLWVALAFLASSAVVMLVSWAMYFDPRILFDPVRTPGVPVKNYIVQGQEFALCAFASLGVAVYLFRDGKKGAAIALIALSIAFVANLVFVASSRTALVCLPLLFALFAVCFFSRKITLLLMLGAVIAGGLAWVSSPYLRVRADMVLWEYNAYQDSNAVTSTGERLEFWRKSIRFIREAPLIGHGTGSTRMLFENAAVGQSGVSARVIANPHNQTLNAAVQWGAVGVFVLWAMWIAHLRLFIGGTGIAAWIGLVAVVENIASSLLNSHLFDFAEGWMYVLAVGVAGGMVLKGGALLAKDQGQAPA